MRDRIDGSMPAWWTTRKETESVASHAGSHLSGLDCIQFLLSTWQLEQKLHLQWQPVSPVTFGISNELIFTQMGLTERLYFRLKGDR